MLERHGTEPEKLSILPQVLETILEIGRIDIKQLAVLMLLRSMGWGDLTTHGFRSTFRDWAAECTNFPAEVAEMALAHTVGDKLEAAYRRGDLFEKRREIMAAWANFIDRDKAATVVPMRKDGSDVHRSAAGHARPG